MSLHIPSHCTLSHSFMLEAGWQVPTDRLVPNSPVWQTRALIITALPARQAVGNYHGSSCSPREESQWFRCSPDEVERPFPAPLEAPRKARYQGEFRPCELAWLHLVAGGGVSACTRGIVHNISLNAKAGLRVQRRPREEREAHKAMPPWRHHTITSFHTIKLLLTIAPVPVPV